MAPPCRVLIIEKSGAFGARLARVFAPPLELIEASVVPVLMPDAVRGLKPSMVLLEAEPSAEVTRSLEVVMAEQPLPVVLLARTPEQRQAAIALMARGALDVIHVPEIIDPAFSVTFRQQLALLSRVKVVRHVRGRRRRTSARLAAVRPDYPVIAIASSLGGPRALAEVLGGLPLGLGAPVVVCQHISPGFADDLARWLTQETGHRVTCAQSGDRLVKGDVFLAPSERHLVVEPSGALTLDDSAPVGGFKPSCDVLLTSVARAFGARAIGVVLTGMGRDGADGLRELRARGGHTIAQDERTSVVFGMPKEAIALGATEKVLPLGQIAAQLARWLS